MTPVAALLSTYWRNGKYPYEYEAAIQFSRILHDGGWWEKARPKQYIHGARCHGVTPSCCSEPSVLLGGNWSCWPLAVPTTYSLLRCCQGNYVSAVIHPASSTVPQWQAGWKPNSESPQVSAMSATPSKESAMSATPSGKDQWHCLPFSPAEFDHYAVWSSGSVKSISRQFPVL